MKLKKCIVTGTLLLTGSTLSFAGTDPETFGAAGVLSLQVFLFFWIASSVVLMGIYGKKWLARYEELQLSEVVPSRSGTLAPGEVDPIAELRAASEEHWHEFEDVDGEHYVCCNSYEESLQLHDAIVRVSESAGPLTEAQAENLNGMISISNWSLQRLNGRVFLSKAAKVIVCIYWGILILWLVMLLMQAFAFSSSQWDWERFFSGVIGVPIAAYGLWQFFRATRVVYQIPGCNYEEYRASGLVNFYSRCWVWLTASTASGAASGLAYSATESATVYRDNYGNRWVEKNSNFAAGMAIMVFFLLLGFLCGGILFFIVQPLLMMWLFKKHFIACERDPGPDAPIWRRPKFPIWASLACGGVMGVIVMILSLVVLLTGSASSDVSGLDETQAERIEATVETETVDAEKKHTETDEKDVATPIESNAASAPAAEAMPNVDAAAKPELTPVEKAMAEIPTDKIALIAAYEREGLIYLDGNSREMLAFIKALNSRRDQQSNVSAILDSFPSVANEVYQDLRSGEKRTAIIWASRNRRGVELVSMLIKAGADVNAVSSIGESALSNAVDCGNVDVAKILIAAGADVDFKPASGRSLLERAAGNQAMSALIFDVKKSFSHEDLKCLLASRSLNVTQVKKVLAAGVKPDDEDMYSAVRKNDAEVLASLLAAGGNANAKYNDTPVIFYCSYRGNIDCAKLLVDHGADTNFTVRISGKISYRTYLKNRKGTDLLAYIEQKTSIK